MGGVMILFSIGVSTLLWANLANPYIWVCLFVLFGYGAIGFVDDFRKITRKNTDGLIARWKYFWMSVVALVAILWLYWLGHDTDATRLVIPFFKDIMPQLGLFYIVLSYFVIVGTGNAVNLTDGLDGLAIMPTALVAGAFALIAWATGNVNFAEYLSRTSLYGRCRFPCIRWRTWCRGDPSSSGIFACDNGRGVCC